MNLNTVIIEPLYNGPPKSGNGGYCSGQFAAQLNLDAGVAVESTLLNPIPMAQALRINHPNNSDHDDASLEVWHEDILIATAQQTQLDFEPMAAPTAQAAKEAQTRFSGFNNHPFPNCFVCGTGRVQQGLQIFCGTLEHKRAPKRENDTPASVAALFQPYPGLANAQGKIKTEFIWAALDCPSYFGAFIHHAQNPAVLGKQCVRILDADLDAHQPYIVQSWPLAHEGRKFTGASALYSEDGRCVALCRATWIELKRPQ